MRTQRTRAGALVVLLLVVGIAVAETSPEDLDKQARELYDAGRYDRALELWMTIIGEHRRHDLVAKGDAHWWAARCLRQLGEYEESVSLLESYLKACPKGEGAFSALSGIFYTWAEAGEEKKAQRAGKRILAEYPIARGTYWVLRTYVERGWKVPKLPTSYDVLHRWTFERTIGSNSPEIRLGFLDLLEANHKSRQIVTGGAILYCRAWALLKAERYAEAVAVGEKHLKLYPRADERDKARMVVAEALLALDPPEIERAKKVLEALLRNPGRYKEQAEKMLAAAETGGTSIQILEGCPKPGGMGKVVLLTDLASRSARLKALEPWREARKAEVVRIRPGGDPSEAAAELARIGPEFVAVAVAPETLDGNFHLSMLELCRGLDRDPMPDFQFGYLVARDAQDLGALGARILEKEKARGTAARDVGVPTSGGQVKDLDCFLHFGHGTPREIVKGLTAEQIAALELPLAPVVVSGACFNGVCSRSFESSLYEMTYRKPREIPPDETVSLAWIHAGAAGVIAALDGDRGEMAMAEWEYLLQTAAPLGDVVGYQYRLAFASLPETYGQFPRYVPGHAKRIGFRDVMLRGMTSRILISDPSFRPLARPLRATSIESRAVLDKAAGEVRVTVKVGPIGSGMAINTLPTKGAIPWREQRVYARVALPADFAGMLARPTVEGSVQVDRTKVRHEIWGGRRYANVLLEAEGAKLARPGTALEVVFPIRK